MSEKKSSFNGCVRCKYKGNSTQSEPCASCAWKPNSMTLFVPDTVPDFVSADQEANKTYWQNICELNERQETKGKSKYGVYLEENTTLSKEQRIEHFEEELIDALKYAEHLKKTFKDKLTANDYQRMAMRTRGEYDSQLAKIRNAAYGMNGEAGEVIDILKKHEFQGHPLNTDKLIDETSDVLWYCALMADALDTTLEVIMLHNIEKLKKRYPDGFDKARSINRTE